MKSGQSGGRLQQGMRPTVWGPRVHSGDAVILQKGDTVHPPLASQNSELLGLLYFFPTNTPTSYVLIRALSL